MRKFLGYSLPVLVCFLVGICASFIQSDALQNWYPYLNKPSLTPPNIVFPIAWSILYICMGISIGYIINTKRPERWLFINVFILQLFLNFTWSILFFYLENPALGMINIVGLDALIIYYAIRAFPIYKLSAILFIPYILWVTFAAYLNLYILLYN